MPRIKITKDSVSSASNRMSTCGSRHDSVIRAIENAIRALDAGWEGDAKNRFVQIWGVEGPKYRSFVGDIKQFSTFLTNYLNAMSSEDKLS